MQPIRPAYLPIASNHLKLPAHPLPCHPTSIVPNHTIMDLFIAAKVDPAKNGDVPTKAVGQREPYRSRITKLYIDGVLHGKLPLVTTDPRYLEKQARECMDKLAFGFVSGAGELATMDANRLAPLLLLTVVCFHFLVPEY